MKVNTVEWLAWRRKHIGASDQVHLQMCAPWSIGWAALWDIKTGAAPEQETNQYMQRGKDLEALALMEYNLANHCDCHPMLAESETYPFMSASFDGIDLNAKKCVEIKCPGAKDHEKAVAGEIPEKYFPQLTHQCIVAGLDSLDYCSYDGTHIAVVKFTPNQEMRDAVISTSQKFWACVEKGVRPSHDDPHPLFDKRAPEITNDLVLSGLAKEWAKNKEMLIAIEKELEDLTERVLDLCDLPKFRVGPISVSTRGKTRSIRLNK